MCGIAGFYNASESTETLKLMISQLAHRGPDGFGLYHRGTTGLAHARLSIIDLNGGWQPIHNEDKTVWVIFNGEIFNYIELRQQFEGSGHTFYTNSDTEVIVHAYETYGPSFAKYLNGQFAIALWDENNNVGVLARDRVGIQPLFYAQTNNSLYFGSEIKSILPIERLRNGLNHQELANAMTFWTTSPGNTVFNGINELRPGYYLEFRNGDVKQVQYFDHTYDIQHYQTDRLAAVTLEEKLRDSVELRLRADVPVAAYLSGGLDSSITTALVRKYFKNDLRTFSIEFADKVFDESQYQQEVVKALGTKHTSFRCTSDDIANAFSDVVYHTEKPIVRTAPAPMYILSKHVREQGYRVVLTGEGADEVFGGYDIFRENYVRRYIINNPDSPHIPYLLGKLYPWMGDRISKSTNHLKSFFSALDDTSVSYFSHEPRWRTTSKSHQFFSNHLPQIDDFSVVDSWFENLPDGYLQRAQYIEFKTLFSGYLISSQGDRMLMANGIEGRFPFLDPNVIDFGNNLDPSLKVHSPFGTMEEKYILKLMADNLIPKSILNRKKQPYMAPDGAAFFGGNSCPEYVNDLLSQEMLLKYGYFNPVKVGFLKNKFEKGVGKSFPDNMSLIGILSTQLLHSHFVDNYTPRSVAPDEKFMVHIV